MTTRHGTLKKPPGALATSSPDAVNILRQLSKAALVDLCAELIACEEDHGDEAATPERIVERVAPVLAARGDRLPKLEDR